MYLIKKYCSLWLVCLLTILTTQAVQASEKQQVLRLYNWASYLGETTLDDFEKETGIKVMLDTFDSYETAEAKMLAGNSGYDLVNYYVSLSPRLIEAGVFKALDKSKLPNWANLNPSILNRINEYDPQIRYGTPYMWGTTGVTYNIDMVRERMPDAPLDSAAMIFDPEIVSRFTDCGVTLLDSPSDVIPMALSYLGLDPNSEQKADIQAAGELLKSVQPYITKFDSAGVLTGLPNKDLCVSMSWSGDYSMAQWTADEAGTGVKLGYLVPKEGAGMWFDAFYILKDAPNASAAHQFLDYLMRPDVIASVSNYVGYANANAAATELVDEGLSKNPAVYPTEESKKILFTRSVKPAKVERLLTRTWNKVKTGR